jgi:hypothetical protein
LHANVASLFAGPGKPRPKRCCWSVRLCGVCWETLTGVPARPDHVVGPEFREFTVRLALGVESLLSRAASLYFSTMLAERCGFEAPWM